MSKHKSSPISANCDTKRIRRQEGDMPECAAAASSSTDAGPNGVATPAHCTMTSTTIRLPFDTPRLAQIAHDSMVVDGEPPRAKVDKEMSVEDNVLVVTFRSASSHNVRKSVNHCFDMVDLVKEGIKMFDGKKT